MPSLALPKLGKILKPLVTGAVRRVGVDLKLKLEERVEVTGELLGSQ